MQQLTHVRFWAGLRSIGGTVVTVEHGEDRVVFDFGSTYRPLDQLLQLLREEDGNPAQIYLRMGVLPPIDGLYPAEAIKGMMSGRALPALSPGDESGLRPPLPAETSGLRTAVFISHLHLDHMSLMGMIAPEVPVYMTEDSLKLFEALEHAGETVPGSRTYSAVPYDQPATCGCIKVTPIRVDHDVPGACGYLIETPELRLFYTGDIRLHGKHPEWTLDMAKRIRDERVDCLVMEGTTLGPREDGLGEDGLRGTGSPELPDGMITELNIAGHLARAMSETNGLAVCNLYHRNLERLQAFHEAASQAGRTLVLEPASAYIAKKLLGLAPLGVLQDEAYSAQFAGIRPESERRILDSCVKVTLAEINADPGQYVLQSSYENLLQLLRVDITGGVYLHSNGVPLGPYDPKHEVLLDFLKRLPLSYRYIGTGGHALPPHLKYIAETISPALFIPLHSHYPERLEISSGLRLLPETGKTYSFRGGRLLYG